MRDDNGRSPKPEPPSTPSIGAGMGSEIAIRDRPRRKYVTLYVSATPLPLPKSIYLYYPKVVMTVEGDDMYYRTDGNDPTSADGHLEEGGDWVELKAPDLRGFRVVCPSGLGKLKITGER